MEQFILYFHKAIFPLLLIHISVSTEQPVDLELRFLWDETWFSTGIPKYFQIFKFSEKKTTHSLWFRSNRLWFNYNFQSKIFLDHSGNIQLNNLTWKGRTRLALLNLQVRKFYLFVFSHLDFYLLENLYLSSNKRSDIYRWLVLFSVFRVWMLWTWVVLIRASLLPFIAKSPRTTLEKQPLAKCY